ncbi:MAG: hypothetical protein HN352_11680 [Bacteroidetes bacterium]|nr:hypothetical protein [Bacteroidota bacterium]MBT3749682.1 hypothetical protein [Bacteroidota bacterium]MBT4400520.1 hypothetical protein [Bacteroidota bacterium]MBT4412255.1 hypothetical protein [Bacteroidota bacterium]MBT5428113.1 hypothetical protein [Bacteroidota bacterium]
MKKTITTIFSLALVFLFIGMASCKKNDPEPTGNPTFAGSAACAECHQEIYDIFIESGHPYKLNKVEGSQPVIPFTTAAGLQIPTPAGYNWADLTYIIGGYGWKVRFLDSEGYIITANGDTQYNLEDGSQVAYHATDPIGTKKYDCGRCHTTNWVSVEDGGSPQDGLAGMDGQFDAGGVHCEQCHGNGSDHIITESEDYITVDRTSELCGQCHYRNADHSIAASGGFIKHHEQYDEYLTSKHNETMTCGACHDPHASVVHDSEAKGMGVTKECSECHSTDAEYSYDNVHMNATCLDCHMPEASKSAIAKGPYQGDVKTHIFSINTDANGEFWSSEGAIANANGEGVTLEMICYKCHKDGNGEGGSNSQKTMEQLAAKAATFHQK